MVSLILYMECVYCQQGKDGPDLQMDEFNLIKKIPWC